MPKVKTVKPVKMTCEECRKRIVQTVAPVSLSPFGHRYMRYTHHRLEQVLTMSESMSLSDVSAAFHQVGIE